MLFLAWEFSTQPTDSKSCDRPKSMCARCPAVTVLAASYSKFNGTMAQKRSLGRTLREDNNVSKIANMGEKMYFVVFKAKFCGVYDGK